MICELIEIDIPQLSSDGIEFGSWSFYCTYSLQSSSNPSSLPSPFDATGLEQYLYFGNKSPSNTSHVVKNRSQLDSIPTDVEDLWIQLFDTTDITNVSFNEFQSLKRLVIGTNLFWRVTSLSVSSLPSLQSIEIGNYCFGSVRLFELDGLSELESVVIGECSFRISGDERNDGSYRIVNCPKLKSIQIGNDTFSDYHSIRILNLPSLQSIEIGEYCFQYGPYFSLIGLID